MLLLLTQEAIQKFVALAWEKPEMERGRGAIYVEGAEHTATGT